MIRIAGAARWQRRAQPWLGTLVEIGVRAGGSRGATVEPANAAAMDAAMDSAMNAAIDAAFDEIEQMQAALSRFDPSSDLSRFHALRCGESVAVRPCTRQVLSAARELQEATSGDFDISLGSAPDGWRCIDGELYKLDAAVRLDLGGIGKGHAVDRAVQTLRQHGIASGWVNAGGDLRCFGEAELPIRLRDEDRGGVRPFAMLNDGAFATSAFSSSAYSTSAFDSRSRSQLARPRGSVETCAVHASVAAPLCLWADALTKVVACSGDAAHPVLARFGALAWLH